MATHARRIEKIERRIPMKPGSLRIPGGGAIINGPYVLLLYTTRTKGRLMAFRRRRALLIAGRRGRR